MSYTISTDYRTVDPTRIPGWNDRIAEFPGSTFFHSSDWARVLIESYRYRPCYGVVGDRDAFDAVVPLMEVDSVSGSKRGVGLPFSDFAAPLIAEGLDRRIIPNLILDMTDKGDWHSCEIKDGISIFGADTVHSENVEHILDIQRNSESIFRGFRSSNQRNIKKARRSGLVVRRDNSLDSLDDFYRLNCQTRKSHGLPPQPKNFFRALYRNTVSLGSGVLFTAAIHGSTVAALFFLLFSKKVLYKFGASDGKYHSLRPNNLLMWEAIKYFADRDYDTLSFGKTEKINTGLMNYKESFGTESRTVCSYLYSSKSQGFIAKKSRNFGFHNHVFRRMPLWLLKIIGTTIYRYAA